MFTAKLNAQMDELEALLATTATTARDNNDNATQNGNSFNIFIRASLQPVLTLFSATANAEDKCSHLKENFDDYT